ncbi:MAG: hypothetical protein ACUVTF_04440 [bacterium]
MVEIKGLVIFDMIKTFKLKWGEGALKKVLDSLDIETRQIFGKQSIPVNDWFPLDAFIKFVEATINLITGGDKEQVITFSEEILLQQLRGIYKVFV